MLNYLNTVPTNIHTQAVKQLQTYATNPYIKTPGEVLKENKKRGCCNTTA